MCMLYSVNKKFAINSCSAAGNKWETAFFEVDFTIKDYGEILTLDHTNDHDVILRLGKGLYNAYYL